MSDTFLLCPKCREQVGKEDKLDTDYDLWKCPNCGEIWDGDELIKESTEYFNDRRGEDEEETKN